MKKYLLVLSALCLVTGAIAQTSNAPMVSDASVVTNTTSKSDAKRDAFNEKHIKDLHTKLKITSDEESLWTSVATTMRSNVQRIDNAVDQRTASIDKASAVDDLNAYASVAQAHADSVKQLAIAFAPLYAAMPDVQKKLADEVFTQRSTSGKLK